MNDPKLLAYLAGVVDALGCIRLRYGKPALVVTETEFRIPYLFERSLGGRVVDGRYILTGDDALRAARLLRPYLQFGADVDAVLGWTPPPPPAPKKKIRVKVPCATGCGRLMVLGSKMCWDCWSLYAKKRHESEASFLKTTARGDGYIEQTATGRIHRLMG